MELNEKRTSSPIPHRQPHQLPLTPPGTPPPTLSPPSTSPPTLMLYDGDGGYYKVPADHVQWEAVAEEDSVAMEVVEDETTPELIIVTDDDDEDVQIVCVVTYRPLKRSRDRSPPPPCARSSGATRRNRPFSRPNIHTHIHIHTRARTHARTYTYTYIYNRLFSGPYIYIETKKQIIYFYVYYNQLFSELKIYLFCVEISSFQS